MDSKRGPIGIALMGVGVVGSGVARILREKAAVYERQIGCPLELRRALVRDANKSRGDSIDPALLTTDPEHIIGDPKIDLIIEMMGGEEPAHTFVRDALKAGKFNAPEPRKTWILVGRLWPWVRKPRDRDAPRVHERPQRLRRYVERLLGVRGWTPSPKEKV